MDSTAMLVTRARRRALAPGAASFYAAAIVAERVAKARGLASAYGCRGWGEPMGRPAAGVATTVAAGLAPGGVDGEAPVEKRARRCAGA